METDKLFIEEKLSKILEDKGLMVSTAESCTGGGVASCLTSISGSSAYFKGGVVAYSNEVKMEVLNVPSHVLDEYGAVSKKTVKQMARGAQELFATECAIATSGIAGPSGGTKDKPVGTIWIAAAYKSKVETLQLTTDNGRAANVVNAINESLYLLYQLLNTEE